MGNKEEQKFNMLPNGDVEGIMTYPENKVTIQLDGREVQLGTSPSYEVKQIIRKDRIPELLLYLKQQKDYFLEKIKSSNEILEKTEHVDIDKLAGSFDALPEKVKSNKKLSALNRLAEDYYMKSATILNLKLLEENMEKIDSQIAFLEKAI
jgi:hypothetical protein